MVPQAAISGLKELPVGETGEMEWCREPNFLGTHSEHRRNEAHFLKPARVRSMLYGYRSRDMARVSAAADWLIQIDVKRTIESLIQRLDHDDPFVTEDAKDLLAAFGEIAFKRVVVLLDEPAQWRNALEILSNMEGDVVPHIVRTEKTTDSFDIRVGLLRALTNHTHHPEAAKAIREGLGDPDPIIGAFVCQALLERGPKGHDFLEKVFPQEQILVA